MGALDTKMDMPWSLITWSQGSHGKAHVDLGYLDLNLKCQLPATRVTLNKFLNLYNLPISYLQDKEANGIDWVLHEILCVKPGHRTQPK